MRVLNVTSVLPPAPSGGYEVAAISAMQSLAAAGHEVSVLTAGPAVPQEEAQWRFGVTRALALYGEGGMYESLSLRRKWSIEQRNRAAFLDALKRSRADLVVWWNMSGVSLSLIPLAARSGLRSAAMVCDWWPLGAVSLDRWSDTWERHPKVGQLIQRISGVATQPQFSSVTRWLFVSNYVRDRLRDELGSVFDGTVLHIGYDEALFAPRPPRQWDNTLMFIGRLVAEKGLDIALRALQLLPECHLHVAGSATPSQSQDARRLADRLGVGSRVSWLGALAQDELSSALGQCDAVVFPVRWSEPWGLVPLEAMASGVPVVATITGGAAEYMLDGENVLAIDQNNPEALAHAVTQLSRSAALRASMRATGLSTASSFTTTRFNHEFEHICCDIAR